MAQDQIRSIQGTEDLLPGQWAHWRRLHATARRLFERYGYAEVRTPVFEDTRLFVKGTGETTDIVEKEMYSIATGSEGSLTLRPEGTPSVIRSYLEHNLHKREPFQKLYYTGPMFRHERPQRGRLRQFHQLGIEAIGSASPLLDAEGLRRMQAGHPGEDARAPRRPHGRALRGLSQAAGAQRVPRARL
jgi:histidyl-tRNA synthetase